jgi:hypothetical protein
MLPFCVTIPATVPQRSEIPEGLMNYPVLFVRSNQGGSDGSGMSGMRRKNCCIECLVGKPEIKRELRGARCRYADKMEVNIREVR